jgi:hypothetical protein
MNFKSWESRSSINGTGGIIDTSHWKDLITNVLTKLLTNDNKQRENASSTEQISSAMVATVVNKQKNIKQNDDVSDNLIVVNMF